MAQGALHPTPKASCAILLAWRLRPYGLVLPRGYSLRGFGCVAHLEAATLHNSRMCLQFYGTDNPARSG